MITTLELLSSTNGVTKAEAITRQAMENGACIGRQIFSATQVVRLEQLRGTPLVEYDPSLVKVLRQFDDASGSVTAFGYSSAYHADIPIGQGRGVHRDTEKFRGPSMIIPISHIGKYTVFPSAYVDESVTGHYYPGDVLVMRNHGVVVNGENLLAVVHSAETIYRPQDSAFQDRVALMMNHFDGLKPLFNIEPNEL